jgi:uncharacterized protein with GYD domain
MPTYVTVVRLTSEGQRAASELAKRWQEGVEKAEQMGIKAIGGYGLLGRYDMMFIYEAPNEKVAAAMPLSFTSRGTSQTETWTAIPMEELARLTAKVKG